MPSQMSCQNSSTVSQTLYVRNVPIFLQYERSFYILRTSRS